MSTSLIVQTIDDKDHIFCRMCKKFKPIEDFHEDEDFVFQFCGDCLAEDHKDDFNEFMICMKYLETLRTDEESLNEIHNKYPELDEKLQKINKKLMEYFK